jgi:membrane protein DedA with SNARE-associated domain
MGLLRWRRLSRLLPGHRLEEAGRWFDRRGWAAVLAARFLPGTRLPLYVAAGVLGRRAGWFLVWAALAGLLWVPLLVLATAALGEVVVRPFAFLLGPGWPFYLPVLPWLAYLSVRYRGC